MRIGFYTSTFNDRPVEEVLDFAAEAGFDAIEIDAGSHIGAAENVAGVVDLARARGLEVCSIALFGNQLDPDTGRRREFHARTTDLARATEAANVPALVLFPGRDPSVSDDDNYAAFASHATALLAVTETLNLAMENWPGPDNDYIATTPAGWDKLFALVPDTRLGLEFDPSHLIRIGVDPNAAFDRVAHRVKLLHGKDTSIDPERLQAVGYHGEGWWRYRLPGSGRLDWIAFLNQAKASGFDGVVSIEHEDADFGWPRGDLAARRAGMEKGLRALRDAMPD